MENDIIFQCLGKGNFFADNSNLSNLVHVQRLNEIGKRMKCVSDGVYTLLKKRPCYSTLVY